MSGTPKRVAKMKAFALRDDLQMRIAWLKQLVAECPVPASAVDEAKHILKTAPQLLGDMERTI